MQRQGRERSGPFLSLFSWLITFLHLSSIFSPSWVRPRGRWKEPVFWGSFAHFHLLWDHLCDRCWSSSFFSVARLSLTLGNSQNSGCHSDVHWCRRPLVLAASCKPIVPGFLYIFFLLSVPYSSRLLSWNEPISARGKLGFYFWVHLTHRKLMSPCPANFWKQVPASWVFQPAVFTYQAFLVFLNVYLKLFSAGKGVGMPSILSSLCKGILTNEPIWTISSPEVLRL